MLAPIDSYNNPEHGVEDATWPSKKIILRTGICLPQRSALAPEFIELYLLNSVLQEKKKKDEQTDMDEDRDKGNRGSVLEKKGTHKMI